MAFAVGSWLLISQSFTFQTVALLFGSQWCKGSQGVPAIKEILSTALLLKETIVVYFSNLCNIRHIAISVQEVNRASTAMGFVEEFLSKLMHQLIIYRDMSQQVAERPIEVVSIPHQLTHQGVLVHRDRDTPRNMNLVITVVSCYGRDNTAASVLGTRSKDMATQMARLWLEVATDVAVKERGLSRKDTGCSVSDYSGRAVIELQVNRDKVIDGVQCVFDRIFHVDAENSLVRDEQVLARQWLILRKDAIPMSLNPPTQICIRSIVLLGEDHHQVFDDVIEVVNEVIEVALMIAGIQLLHLRWAARRWRIC